MDSADTEHSIYRSVFRAYAADALDVVELKFVDSLDEIDKAKGYEVEFAHQHFADEVIIGYKNPKIFIHYSDASLYVYPTISFEMKMPKNEDFQSDNILNKIATFLPSPETMKVVDSDFKKVLDKQKDFKPYGTLITKFYRENSMGEKLEFQLYKLQNHSDDATEYLERAESIAFWYIDAVNYTDTEDERFFHYFIFQYSKYPDGNDKYTFAGYSTLYRFYNYPDRERIRIAQILIVPPYRHSGIGVKFLDAIYGDLKSDSNVYDITAESPADNFIYMRDYVDCVNCVDLDEFSKENLKKGYSKNMEVVAREKLKLNSMQSRRVYEILRLHHTNMNITEETDAYKKAICLRIEKPLKRTKRDICKLNVVLEEHEVKENLDPVKIKEQVEQLYENTLDVYTFILKRLKTYETNKF